MIVQKYHYNSTCPLSITTVKQEMEDLKGVMGEGLIHICAEPNP